jgi:hypothetical protein
LTRKEFEEEIEKLAEKASKLIVDEDLLTESVAIDGRQYSVFLGDKVIHRVDGKENEWQFHRDYKASEPKWQTLLGGLKTRVALAEELNTSLIKAMVLPYLSEAVVDRMTGSESDVEDNEALLRKAGDRRLGKLTQLVPRFHDDIYFNTTFPLASPSENFDLSIRYVSNQGLVQYGNMGNKKVPNLKCYWSFLSNYETITKTVKDFSQAMKPVITEVNKSVKEGK